MRIVPALLAATADALAEQFSRLGALTGLVHYDVADGRFVAAQTPPPSDYPQPNPGQRILWHLMTHEPAALVSRCTALPTEAIIVHAEAHGVGEALETIAALGISAGLALNPSTTVESVTPLLGRVQLVQVMTVEPGQQGRPFLPGQLEKLTELRLSGISRLAVDGGISRGTIEQVARYHPDYLFVGSALTTVADPAAMFRLLNSSISGGDGDDTGT